MQEKHAKWLTGCGLGCAAVVVLVIVVGLGAYFAVRDTVRDFKKVDDTVSSVDRKHGAARDYTPDPEGRIPADRIEAFLAVRNRTLKTREEFGQTIGDLEAASSGQKRSVRDGLKTARSALGIPRLISRLYSDRANALLENQMGFGEYLYIYSVAYYSFLKKDPVDGPQNLNMVDNHTLTVDGENASEAARENHRRHVIGEVHRLFAEFLRNALEPGPDAEADPTGRPHALGKAELEWRQAVQKELEALDSKLERIPWEDGLPKQIEQSLAPFRTQLEATYDPTINIFEFAQTH